MKTPGFRERGGGWVVSQSILLVLLVAAGPLFRNDITVPMNFLCGWIFFFFGALLGVLGVKHLGQNRTAYPQPLAHGELVTTGIYAFVRHPLYSSLIFAGLGWALIWNSAPALCMAAVNFFFFNAKANKEEQWLRERFPTYVAYAQKVKRLIPFVY